MDKETRSHNEGEGADIKTLFLTFKNVYKFIIPARFKEFIV
jgi:hypothetical protein